jgi:hypothetical protein
LIPPNCDSAVALSHGRSAFVTESVDPAFADKRLTYYEDPEPKLRFLVKNQLSHILTHRGGQNDDFLPLTYTLGEEGHGVQGQICDILRPQLAMNRFLPLWPHRFPHYGYIHLGGGGVGALILDRCRAFNLFASVDAHLCL